MMDTSGDNRDSNHLHPAEGDPLGASVVRSQSTDVIEDFRAEMVCNFLLNIIF